MLLCVPSICMTIAYLPPSTSLYRRTQTKVASRDSRSQSMLLTAVGGHSRSVREQRCECTMLCVPTLIMKRLSLGTPCFPPEASSIEDLGYMKQANEDGVLMPHAMRAMEAL